MFFVAQKVVQHVQSSPHRPSCRRRVVPLQFVLNPAESYRRFLVEFNKIFIQGLVSAVEQLLNNFSSWVMLRQVIV
jgi:hypothetical protein